MYQRADVIYGYDGSFDGLLCCVFESFRTRRRPVDIHPPQAQVQLLYPVKNIPTDVHHAQRVEQGITKSISQDVLALAQLGMYTQHPGKARLIHDFICMGFDLGPKVIHYLTDDTVNALHQAVRHLKNEAHLLTGFIRFSQYGQVMAAQISPKNQVLPLLQPHFCERFACLPFIIYDHTHQQALVHDTTGTRIMDVTSFTMPDPSMQEVEMRRLWKQFYDTVAIKGRENPRCRMGHMPKRYWKYMTEFGLHPKPTQQGAPALPHCGTCPASPDASAPSR